MNRRKLITNGLAVIALIGLPAIASTEKITTTTEALSTPSATLSGGELIHSIVVVAVVGLAVWLSHYSKTRLER